MAFIELTHIQYRFLPEFPSKKAPVFATFIRF